jgi:small subunit ribosomal protein S1
MVIEFDRNEKRIVLSHHAIWERAKQERSRMLRKKEKQQKQKTPKKAVKNIQQKVEKATWATWCFSRSEEETGKRRKIK